MICEEKAAQIMAILIDVFVDKNHPIRQFVNVIKLLAYNK